MGESRRKRLRPLLFRGVAVAVLAGVLATVAMVAIGESGGRGFVLRAPPASAAAGSPTADVDPALLAMVSALRRPLTGTDGIPSDVQVTDGNIDTAHARRIEPVAPDVGAGHAGAIDSRLWLSPDLSGEICLQPMPPEADGPALACGGAREVSAGRLLLTQTWTARRVELYGVVPDGVSSVRVSLEDGGGETLPVRDNVYAARFDSPTRSVAFTDSAGVSHEVSAGTEY